jgi:PAS domain S-box-containing protein
MSKPDKPSSLNINILHVDDDKDHLRLIKMFLEKINHSLRVTSIESPENALKELEKKNFDCILIDYVMSKLDGLQLAEKIRQKSDTPIILYTGQGSEDVAKQAFKIGVDNYIRKETHPAHYQVLAQNIQNIVEKHRVNTRLRGSERQLSILDNMLEGCQIIDTQYRYRYLNNVASRHGRRAKEELLGRTMMECYPDIENTEMFHSLTKCMKEGIPVQMENLFKYPDGSTAWFELSFKPIPEGAMILSIDVTEREETLQRFGESDRRYRMLVEGSPLPMSVTIGDTIVYVNKKRLELTGHTDLATLMGTSGLDDVNPDDRALILRRLKAQDAGECVPPVTWFRLTRVDGSTIHVEDHVSEAVWEGEKAVIHSLVDITDRVRYEGQLEALNRHAAILAVSNDYASVVETTLNTVEEVTGFNYISFMQRRGDYIQSIGGRGATSLGREFKIDGRGITVKAVREKMAVLVNDLRGDPDYVQSSVRSLSELAVPVVVAGEVEAVINVESADLNAFTEEDRIILEILASHVASALQRLFEQEKQVVYVRSLEALHRHAYKLAAAGNFSEIGETTFNILEDVLGFDTGSFIRVRGGFSEIVYHKGINVENVRSLPLDGPGVTVRAVNTGETQLVPNTRLDTDYFSVDVEGTETRSELVVPVKVGGEVVAVINLESTEAVKYTEMDKVLVEIMAQHIASAIQSLRDQAKRQRYEERLEILHSHASKLAAVETVEEVAERTLNTVESVLGFTLMEFAIVEDKLRFILRRDVETMIPIELPLDGPGVTVRAVKTGETQRVADIGQDEDYVLGLGEEGYKILSELAVPVKASGKVVAVINIESEEPGAFTEEDRRLVEIFAEHVASALRSIRAAEERRRYEERLEALSRVMGSMNTAQSLGELVDQTLAIVEEVIVVPFSAYMLVEGDELVTFRIRGAPLTGVRLSINGTGITARAAREKRPILVGDTRLDSDFVKGSTDSLSELDVPVVTNGEVVGVLNMESLELDYFDASHVSLAEALASHVSSNLERLKHFKEVQEMERTRAREAVESVAKIGSMVRHDLRGPLAAIGNAAYLLKGNPEDTKVLEIIDRSVSRAAEILEDLRERTWTGSLTPAPTDLVGLIRETVEGLGAPEGVNVTLKLHDGVNGMVDGAKIRRVVENLVLNAFDAMPDGGELRVEEQVNDGCLVLRVSDTGVGIPSESLSKLFTPFFTTKKSGTGLGLVYCRQVVEAHGGTVSVESEAGRGTSFTVKLPLG